MKKRIQSLSKVLHAGIVYIKVELNNGYSFNFSGTQTQYCLSYKDLYDTMKYVVYCE